jgi:uncharacterized protein YndB with AHSA1/START domain
MMTERIVVEAFVGAPVEAVWNAYLTPSDILVWNTASPDWHTTSATVDLQVGGKFSSRMEAKDGSFGFDFEGTYTKIVTHQVLEYNFGDRTASIEFLPQQDGVLVRVAFDPEYENPIEMQRGGWQAILANFARYVESR